MPADKSENRWKNGQITGPCQRTEKVVKHEVTELAFLEESPRIWKRDCINWRLQEQLQPIIKIIYKRSGDLVAQLVGAVE